jgi:DNA-binding winged helix-turn-helix (wHTH) protein
MALVVCRTYFLLDIPLEVESGEPGWQAFRLGRWLVEPLLNRVSSPETSTQLELKVMDLLVCLAERAGQVVSRREITDAVWPKEFIADNTLSRAITVLRSALGDDAKKPRFIETIHRRGYRLIASVEPASPDEVGGPRVVRLPVSERTAAGNEGGIQFSRLAAYMEEDPEIIIGRQAEVAEMWRKLASRHLLVVIEPLPGWKSLQIS